MQRTVPHDEWLLHAFMSVLPHTQNPTSQARDHIQLVPTSMPRPPSLPRKSSSDQGNQGPCSGLCLLEGIALALLQTPNALPKWH